MDSNRRLMLWVGVPDGSQLEVSVSGSDSTFQVTGVQTRDSNPPQPLVHTDVVPANTPLPLAVPSVYGMTLNVTFLGPDPTTVTIEGVVRKPDGKPYGDPRRYTTTGSNNATDIAILSIFTKQS